MANKTIKTSIDIIQDVIGVLGLFDVASNAGITGDVRMQNRRLDSSLEDIVVNVSHASANQTGNSYGNINIHVPNLKNQTSENPTVTDNTQPDIARMKAISEKVIEAIEDYRGEDFFIYLEEAGEIVPNGKGWFYNISFRYTTIRKDKN